MSTAQCDAAGVGRHRRAALRDDGSLVPVVRGVHDAAGALVRRYGPRVLADPPDVRAGATGSAAVSPAPVGPAPVRPAAEGVTVARSPLPQPTPRQGWSPQAPRAQMRVQAAATPPRTAGRAGAPDGAVRGGPVVPGEPDRVDRGHDHRRRRAAWTALLALGPERAVAVGACALALHGVEGLPRTIRPEAALPVVGGRHHRGDARVRRFRTGDVVVVRGARAVRPELALAQAVCELSREHAVGVLDSAVRRGLVAPDLACVRALARGRRGAARLARWWELVDGRADSPLETRARLQCVDAGLAPDELQVPVRDADGRVVARGDLGWWTPEGRLVVVEIDGAGPHATPAALYRDRERQNAIVATGALLLRFTADDVAAGRVARTLARHLLRPATP
ncbi:hypothetical protein LFM56_12725 [Cellulomonas iranensis]|uniref:hypothetical protein n=1 Tax=Cellulomonas iranensis TaxID=76862 RepID=UPI001CF2979E|nr:hypothetical protein [Cellulomonas iranensis]UCN13763.1 hypothetical protein LFM56_12725 [Cellulomonas iranensis]